MHWKWKTQNNSSWRVKLKYLV